MNMILLFITGVALTLAGFMSAVAWQLSRNERRRSDARVAALAEALYDDSTDKSQIVQSLLETRPISEWKRQLFAAGVGIATVAVAASLMAIPARMENHSAKTSRFEAPAHGVSGLHGSTSATLQRSDVPLELIALEHERTGDDLIVRGLVRNPMDAAERDGLSAVVLVLGPGGDVVATARAALPAARLAPGATTPFVVNVTGAADVERFRLSFRVDGRVEPHVDRRGPQTPQG